MVLAAAFLTIHKKMKNHYLIKLKTGELDENGFDCYKFHVTRKKFKSAKDLRKELTEPRKHNIGGVWYDSPSLFEDKDIADITPCSKDWHKK